MTPLSPQSPQSPSGGGDALNSSGEQERSDEDGSLDVVIPSPVQSPEVSNVYVDKQELASDLFRLLYLNALLDTNQYV